MRKLALLSLSVLCCMLIACNSDENNDQNTDSIPTTEAEIKASLVKYWETDDSESPYKSIEFKQNGGYTIIDSTSKKTTGTFIINGDLKTLVLDSTNSFSLINLTSDNLKFSIKTNSGKVVTLSFKSATKLSVGILYTSNGSLYYCDDDGSNPTLIVKQSDLTLNGEGYVYAYNWFPDGSKVFMKNVDYDKEDNDRTDLFTVNIDGTSLKPVNKSNFEYFDFFAITNNGESIVYSNYKEIYTSNIDGTNRQKVYSIDVEKTYLHGMCVSPNGEKILFSQYNENSPGSIYSIDYNGSNLKVIKSDQQYFYFDPQFSFDGNFITYTRGLISYNPTYINDIMILNLQNNKETLVVSGKVIGWPYFHPNGKSIYFRSSENNELGGDCIMSSVNIDGTNLTVYNNIRGNSGEQPDFKPIVLKK